MKKLAYRALPAFGALVIAADATAQVLYEPFNYTAGTTLTPGTTATGYYNSSQGTFWNRTGTSANDLTIGATPLISNYSGLPPVLGNGVQWPSSSGDNDRLGLGTLQYSGNIYYSMLLKLTALPATTTGVFVAGFNNYVNPQSGFAGTISSRLAIKKTADGTHWTVGLDSTGGTFMWDNNTSFNANDEVFVVVRESIDPTTLTNDQMALWINPTSFGAASEPGSPNVSVAVGTQDSDATSTTPPIPQLASIVLRTSTGGLGVVQAGEVRVDASWAGVAPDGTLQYTYARTGDGNWSDSNSWTNSAGNVGVASPNQLGAVANFNSVASGPATVTVDSPQTIDTINITGNNAINIVGQPLTISSNASMGQIITHGNQTFGAPLVLNHDLAFKPASGTTLTLNAPVSAAGFTLHKYAGGTVKLTSENQIVGSPNLDVRVGTLDLGGTSQTVGNIILGVGSDNSTPSVGGPDFGDGSITNGNLNISGTSTLYSGTISAALTGTGSIEKWASTPVTFSGQNTYSGTTKILWGTVVAATIDTLSPNSALTVNTVLDMTNKSQVTGSLNGSGAVRIGSATLDVGNDNGNGTFSGNIATFAGNVGGVLIKSGTGNFTINGALSSYDGGTIIKGGSISVAADGAMGTLTGGVTLNGGTLNITTGFTSVRNYTVGVNNGGINIADGQSATLPSVTGAGVLTKSGNGQLALNSIKTGGLNVSTGMVTLASGTSTSVAAVLGGLTISPGATLDITNRPMVVTYTGTSPAGDIRTAITHAYDAGAWDLPGLTSTTAGGDVNQATGVGYAEASDIGVIGGSFDGQAITGPAVLVKYTYYGDANLDGVVNLDDFSLFIDGFNHLGSGWIYGDFNYDGTIDQTDFAQFVNGYNLMGTNPPLSQLILSDSELSQSQKAALLSAVPEPTSLGIFAIGAGAMAMRRRRKAARSI